MPQYVIVCQSSGDSGEVSTRCIGPFTLDGAHAYCEKHSISTWLIAPLYEPED